jgi:hypothetical protein
LGNEGRLAISFSDADISAPVIDVVFSPPDLSGGFLLPRYAFSKKEKEVKK